MSIFPINKNSLRIRLVIVFVSLAILPVSVVGIFTGLKSFESSTEVTYKHQKEVAHRIAVQVSSFLNQFQKSMQYFSGSLNLNASRIKQKQMLDEFIIKNRAFANASLTTPKGIEIIRVSRTQLVSANENLIQSMNSKAFINAIELKQFYAGKIYFHNETGEPLIRLALPIFNLKTGDISLVLMVTAKIRTIWALVTKTNKSTIDDIYITDDANRVIAHSNPTIVLRETIFKKTEGVSVIKGLTGSQVIIASHQVIFGHQIFNVLVERNAANALAFAKESLIMIMVTMFVALITSVIIIIITIKKIINPIECLSMIVHSIRDGDFSHKAALKYNDEIGQLSQGVNEMSLKLQATIKTLKKSEDHTRLLLNSAAEAIFGLNIDGVCTFANPSCVKILGYKNDKELIGQNIHNIIHHKMNDGTHYSEENCPSTQTLQTGIANHIDNDVLWRADGTSIPVEYLTHPIISNGEITGAVVTFLDITKRVESQTALQESEAYMRTLIETLPDLVWLKDPNGVYLGCNLKFEKLYGAPEKEIIGKTDYDFIDKELADFFITRDQHAIDEGRPVLNEEQVTFADGHIELIETIKTPMYSSKGQLIGVLGVGRDITQRKQTEEALRRSQKMEAVGQLTGGIAHDFNNLLGIILGNIELISNKKVFNDKTIKQLDSIRKAGLRAADLTKQLLNFSRNKPAQLIITDINKQVQEMESLITRSITPEIEIRYQFAEDLWETNVDPGDFEDALLNLCINARDAINGHGYISIETNNKKLDTIFCAEHTGASPGDYVQVIVRDNGGGIPVALQEHIFEPFFTTKEQGKGTGLGLAMVFGFINRSKGYIDINSGPGIGTSFYIYLPRSTHKISAHQKNKLEEEHITGGSETVLIVDDEPELLKMAKIALEEQGYHILTANNGPEALKQLNEESQIDLLVSDIVMPGGMNGYELAQQATSKKPELKVLLSSGYSENTMKTKEQACYDSNILKKPYTLSELIKNIRDTLDSK